MTKAFRLEEIERDLHRFDEDVCDVCEQVYPYDERDDHPCWMAGLEPRPIDEQILERLAARRKHAVKCAVVAPDVFGALLERLGPHVCWFGDTVGVRWEYSEDDDPDYPNEEYPVYAEGAHSVLRINVFGLGWRTPVHQDETMRPGGARLEFWPPVQTARGTGWADAPGGGHTSVAASDILKRLYPQGTVRSALLERRYTRPAPAPIVMNPRDFEQLRQSITLSDAADVRRFEVNFGSVCVIRLTFDPAPPPVAPIEWHRPAFPKRDDGSGFNGTPRNLRVRTRRGGR